MSLRQRFQKQIKQLPIFKKELSEHYRGIVFVERDKVLAVFDQAVAEQNEQLQKLRAWLESRKEQYNHNPHEIDFSKDIDDGLQILDKLLPQTTET